MKIIKFLPKYSWILLELSSILALLCLNQSSVYSNNSNQETAKPIPQEQEQETFSIPENQINIYRNVQQEVCRMSEESEDINLAIPIEQTHNDNNLSLANSINFEAIGFVSLNGQPLPITAKDICNMLQAGINNGDSFDTRYFELEKILIADASSSFFQARTVSVIDLIIRNQRNNKYYLLPNARVDDFFQDAVNAFLNNIWRKNETSLRNMNLESIEE